VSPLVVRATYAMPNRIDQSLCSRRSVSNFAEERTPAAELITKARRFMDVSFTSDMFASFKIFGVKAKVDTGFLKKGGSASGEAITGQE
jgi:hypothetical protein